MWRIALVCAALLMPASVQGSSILLNGSFEQTAGMPSNGELVAGSTALTGWTISGTSTANDVVDWVGPGGGGPVFNIADASHAVDLDGRDSLYGTISQAFATVLGQSYDVAFDLSGNPGDAPTNGLPRVKLVRVTAGRFSQDYQFDTTGMTPPTITWQPIAFSFVASSLTTTLSFTSLTGVPNDYGAMIDNVRVVPTPVPEPTPVVLLGCGLAAGAGRRVSRFLRRLSPVEARILEFVYTKCVDQDCMKVTSQMRSPTCVTPHVLSGKHLAEIHLLRFEADPAAAGHGDGLVMKRVCESVEPRHARGERTYRSAGTFMPSAWCGRSRL